MCFPPRITTWGITPNWFILSENICPRQVTSIVGLLWTYQLPHFLDDLVVILCARLVEALVLPLSFRSIFGPAEVVVVEAAVLDTGFHPSFSNFHPLDESSPAIILVDELC